jgi:hypothetical protein
MGTPTEPAADPVHDGEADRWGGWDWRNPRYGDHFRTCSYCGSIHPEDLAAELVAAGPCAGCGGEGVEGHYRNTISELVHRGVANGTIDPASLSDDERRRLDVPDHSYDPGGAYPAWSDQKYGWPHKFYVEGIRARDPKLLHCFGHYHGEAPPKGDSLDWIAASDLTRAQRKVIREGGMAAKGERLSGWYTFRPKTTLFAKFYTAHLADPRLPAEAREKIEQASGVRFHFSGGTVLWHGVAIPCEETQPSHEPGGVA